jgi:hypothetical protein
MTAAPDSYERAQKRPALWGQVHLHAGDDVFKLPVTVLRLLPGGEELKPRGYNHRTHLILFLLLLHGKVNGTGRAGGRTLAALGANPAVQAPAGTVPLLARKKAAGNGAGAGNPPGVHNLIRLDVLQFRCGHKQTPSPYSGIYFNHLSGTGPAGPVRKY